MDGLEEVKQRARAMWAAGDYDAIVHHILPVGRSCVAHAGISAGDEVLDVACGSGNAAIPAALAGGKVTGVDLTPELFDAARDRATEAGVTIELLEGDAEALPFDDASFDVVISTFGCMFAPHHHVAAEEIARVLRPGGRTCICSWTPEGAIGEFFRTVAGHLPPPPPDFSPPPLWGTTDHVRRLFEGTGVELEFEREDVEMVFDSPEEMLDVYSTKFGPVLMAKAALEPQGRWQLLRDDLLAFAERAQTPDGEVRLVAEYLVATGRKTV